ncbi:MAG: hypothetical protein RSA79_07875, partial [Oscillospiraceae bacterium]
MLENSCKSSALKQFKKNIGKCIALTTLIFASFLTLPMIYILCETLSNKFLTNYLFLGGSTNSILSLFIAVLCYFFVLAPMFLEIKKWFLLMTAGRPPIYRALQTFKQPKRLAKSIWYCVTKSAIIITAFSVLFLSQFAFFLNLKTFMNSPQGSGNPIFKIIYGAILIYFIIASLFFLYFLVLIFFADYIYFYNKNLSALKAMRISIQVAKNEYRKIVAVIANMFPYMLSCFLVIPAVFAVPYIKAYF